MNSRLYGNRIGEYCSASKLWRCVELKQNPTNGEVTDKTEPKWLTRAGMVAWVYAGNGGKELTKTVFNLRTDYSEVKWTYKKGSLGAALFQRN